MLSPHWYLVIVFPLLHLPHLLWLDGWMVWLISDTVRVSSLARIFRLNGHNVFYVATTVTYSRYYYYAHSTYQSSRYSSRETAPLFIKPMVGGKARTQRIGIYASVVTPAESEIELIKFIRL